MGSRGVGVLQNPQDLCLPSQLPSPHLCHPGSWPTGPCHSESRTLAPLLPGGSAARLGSRSATSPAPGGSAASPTVPAAGPACGVLAASPTAVVPTSAALPLSASPCPGATALGGGKGLRWGKRGAGQHS